MDVGREPSRSRVNAKGRVVHRTLTPEAVFQRSDDGAVRLAREGHAAIIGGYQARLAGAVQSPRTKRRVTWRRLIQEEAVAYARHCRGEAGYVPYRLDH